MKNITIRFGLTASAIIIVYTFIILIAFGDFSKMSLKQFKVVEALGYVRYLILLLTIFFAMRTFIKESSHPVNYRSILLQGLMVVLLMAVLIGVMEYVYMVVTPDFYEKYTQLYEQQLKHSGATNEALNQAKQEMNNYKWMRNPIMTGVFYFFETAVIGSVAALIIGLFMTKKSTAVA